MAWYCGFEKAMGRAGIMVIIIYNSLLNNVVD